MEGLALGCYLELNAWKEVTSLGPSSPTRCSPQLAAHALYPACLSACLLPLYSAQA